MTLVMTSTEICIRIVAWQGSENNVMIIFIGQHVLESLYIYNLFFDGIVRLSTCLICVLQIVLIFFSLLNITVAHSLTVGMIIADVFFILICSSTTEILLMMAHAGDFLTMRSFWVW